MLFKKPYNIPFINLDRLVIMGKYQTSFFYVRTSLYRLSPHCQELGRIQPRSQARRKWDFYFYFYFHFIFIFILFFIFIFFSIFHFFFYFPFSPTLRQWRQNALCTRLSLSQQNFSCYNDYVGRTTNQSNCQVIQ